MAPKRKSQVGGVIFLWQQGHTERPHEGNKFETCQNSQFYRLMHKIMHKMWMVIHSICKAFNFILFWSFVIYTTYQKRNKYHRSNVLDNLGVIHKLLEPRRGIFQTQHDFIVHGPRPITQRRKFFRIEIHPPHVASHGRTMNGIRMQATYVINIELVILKLCTAAGISMLPSSQFIIFHILSLHECII